MSKGPKLFVVQSRDFRIHELERADAFGDGSEEWQAVRQRYPEPPPAVRRAFPNRTDAEALLAKLEKDAFDSYNLRPFYAAAPRGREYLFGLTDFDPPVFLDWCVDHGVSLPPDGKWVWSEAWEEWLGGLTRQQIADLFRALHKLAYYELVEVDWDVEPGEQPIEAPPKLYEMDIPF
jgi:hypothetical protein